MDLESQIGRCAPTSVVKSFASDHDHGHGHDQGLGRVSPQRHLKEIDNKLRKDWEIFFQYLEKEGFLPRSHRSIASLRSKTSASSSCYDEQRKPLDLSHHLNKSAKRRNPSFVKGFYKYFFIPGIRNLAGGLPSPDFFPYDTLEAVVATPNRNFFREKNGDEDDDGRRGPRSISRSSWWRASKRKDKQPSDGEEAITCSHLMVPKYGPPGSNPFAEISLSTALQYGTASGYGPLREFVKDFTFNYLHKPAGGIPYSSPAPEIILTCGNTDGFNKVCQMLLEEGDYLLVEEFTYMNALQTATPLGVTIVPVKIDENGICPEDLKRILSTWQHPNSGITQKPKLLYTVSIGQNPTGSVVPLSRRKQIYSICEEYDIVIAEDEPYWHLQFGNQNSSPPVMAYDDDDNGVENENFIPTLVPSYLTLDTAGRVIRLDTFSKTIAPGCRLGWITAQPLFIERLTYITETSSQQPSGFVQALVAELLTKKWGIDGWIRWLENLRDGYERKMRATIDELEKGRYLFYESEDADSGCFDSSLLVINKTELFSFKPPKAGMFVWLQVNICSHPLYQTLSQSSTLSASAYLMRKLFIYLTTPEGGLVLLCPGFIFAATKEVLENRNGHEGLRISFATPSEEVIREGVRGFNSGIKKFWGLSKEEIEKIGDSDQDEEEQHMEQLEAEVDPPIRY